MTAYGSRHQQKRHGKHQKHTKPFLKVYSPYLPLMMIVLIGLYIGSLMPPQIAKPKTQVVTTTTSGGVKETKEVLAYATSMSASALLSSTNSQRSSHGAGALKINSKLASAAQQKANDMISKNYWSHDPPGCSRPGTCWYAFVNSSGYKYKALGENLAYGFDNSSDTVSGWMASPEHRANMLNKTYTEVGFGYANGSNFNHSGQQTVVVAEYALPLSTTSSPAPAPASSSSSGGSTKASNTTVPTTSSAAPAPKATPSPAQTTKKQPVATNPTTPIAESTDNPAAQTITAAPSVKVSRLSFLTNGNFPWLASVVTALLIASLAVLALRHTIAIRKWIKNGERYVMHHALFDITIVSFVGLCVLLNQSPNMFVR